MDNRAAKTFNARVKKAYLKMLKGMVFTGERDWSVYMIRCEDGTLYTGVTKDLERRMRQHARGTGAAYTATHRPVAVVFREHSFTRSEALVREAQIKRMPRSAKEKLAAPFSPLVIQREK